MRIVAAGDHGATRSVLLRSVDAAGARFLVTSVVDETAPDADDAPYYLTKAYASRYLGAHGGRPGICALAFACADPNAVAARFLLCVEVR